MSALSGALTASALQPTSLWSGCCSGDSCPAPHAVPWLRLVIGLFVAAQTMSLGLAINVTAPEQASTRLALQGGMLLATAVVAILLGGPLLRQALQSLRRGQVCMELLFISGIGAALGISLGAMVRGEGGSVYFDTVNVLLVVYSAGRMINERSRGNALSAIHALRTQASLARCVDEAGNEKQIDVTQVRPGQRVRVAPGEMIPVDGVIRQGRGLVRQTPFTGEWLSTPKFSGQAVLAGTYSEDGMLLIEATRSGSARQLDALLESIVTAGQIPTHWQRLTDRWVRYFLPLVAVVALGAMLYWQRRGGWNQGLFTGLSVLLVACPCAAGLATPLAFWTVLSRLSLRGLMLRSGDSVEKLAQVRQVIFDKTGTLSEAALRLESVEFDTGRIDPATAMAYLSLIEAASSHPVARAIRAALDAAPPPAHLRLQTVRQLPGRGVLAFLVDEDCERVVRLTRNDDLCAQTGKLVLDMELDDRHAGRLRFAEALRGEVEQTLAQLRHLGVSVRVFTGDGAAGAQGVAQLAPTLSGMTPQEKLAKVQETRREDAQAGLLYVGDGLNDAAAMNAASVSIALADGSQIAVQSASATLHGGNLQTIPDAIHLCRQAVRTVRGNLLWAVSYNVIGMAVAAGGYLHPIFASLLMACSSLLVAWRSAQLRGPEETWGNASAAAAHASLSLVHPMRKWRLRIGGTIHMVAVLLQLILAARLADLDKVSTALLLVAGAAAMVNLLKIWPKMNDFWDMTFGMLTVGGLGMNWGWWMDMGYAAAVRGQEAIHCCAPSEASMGGESHWMYWLMLAAGVPAMYLLRNRWAPFSFKRWCCVGMLVAGVPAMCLGMWAGAVWAARFTTLVPSLQILLSYAMMMAGMALGMAAAHAMELLLPRSWRSSASAPAL